MPYIIDFKEVASGLLISAGFTFLLFISFFAFQLLVFVGSTVYALQHRSVLYWIQKMFRYSILNMVFHISIFILGIITYFSQLNIWHFLVLLL
ncbi:MAG: hypothetical protein NZ522_07015, partial [Chitinophagales bacterium]|nr:hypothetical protein [Chitinophagales bacterium]